MGNQENGLIPHISIQMSQLKVMNHKTFIRKKEKKHNLHLILDK